MLKNSFLKELSGGTIMKKILAVCLTFAIIAMTFAFLPANAAKSIDSPVAPTYTEKNPGDFSFDELFNELSYLYPIVVDYFVKGASHVFSILNPYFNPGTPGTSGKPGSTNKSGTPGTPGTPGYSIKGMDDPNSPNYTGKRNVSKDKSSSSPDTATGPNYAPVVIAVITLMGTLAFAGTSLKKKESSK